MKRVVLTGPESTGKSTLASLLGRDLECPIVEEYARDYISQLKLPYSQSDLLQIAEGQFLLERKAKESTSLLICDTDLLTIKIWSEFKYGKCDSWIIQALKNNLPDLYLVCYPDLPWEHDPQRENPNQLKELFDIYLREVKELGVAHQIIQGRGDARLQNAMIAVKEIII